MMDKLSALGDSALLMPASLALLAFLAVQRRLGLAMPFAAGLAACGVATLATKLLFNACGQEISGLDLISPSGHASFATLVYGSLALMIGTGRPAWQAGPIALAAAILVAGIGVSRIEADVHSLDEVVFGWGLGAASLALVAVLHARAGRPPLPALAVSLPADQAQLAIGLMLLARVGAGIAGALFALLLVGGREFTPEAWIARTARRLTAMADICGAAPAHHAGVALGRARP